MSKGEITHAKQHNAQLMSCSKSGFIMYNTDLIGLVGMAVNENNSTNFCNDNGM